MLKKLKVTLRQRALNLAMVASLTVSLFAPTLAMVPKAFALAGPPPVNVQAYVGGNSIALEWNPATGDTPTQYKIYRGGVLKATIAATNAANHSGTVQRWYDTAVTNGTTYSYQVSALNAASEESTKTTAINVTQPATPVVVPTVTIDPSTPSAYLAFANAGKALLQTWYPKFVTKLGNPTGTPTSMTLVPKTSAQINGNTMQTDGTTIEYNMSWVDAHTTDPTAVAIFLHESMHVAQLGGTPTAHYLPWVHEGMADYAEAYWFADDPAQTINNTTDNYLMGYRPASYFFNWIMTTYSKPNFIKDLSASFAPHYSLTFFKSQTGLTVGELWQKMSGRRMSSPILFRNLGASQKCLDDLNSVTTPGNDLQITPCTPGNDAQQFVWIPDSTFANQGELRVKIQVASVATPCVDVWGSGTTAGTKVDIYTCNNSVAQKWIMMSNGALKNPNSGMCLQPVGGGTATGTTMEISPCTGALIQNWWSRPPGMLKSWNGLGCPGVAAASVGTPVLVYTCNDGGNSQTWTFLPSSIGATTGAVQILGNRCLQPVGGSTAVNTTMEISTCTGGTIQQWQWQGDNTVKNIGSGYCLTIPAWASPWTITQASCASPTTLKQWDVLYQF